MVRGGFTVIELLAATLLASLLLASLLGVLVSLTRQERLLLAGRAAAGWEPQLAALVEADLAAAESYTLSRTALVLFGYGGSDPATGLPLGKPVEIRYALETINKRTWLTRREQVGDAASRQLICADAGRIDLVTGIGPAWRAETIAVVRETPLLPHPRLVIYAADSAALEGGRGREERGGEPVTGVAAAAMDRSTETFSVMFDHVVYRW